MTQVKVTKMHCGGCAKPVTRATVGVGPGAAVDIDLKQGVIFIATSHATMGLRFEEAIRAAGFGAEPLTLAA